MQFTAGLQTLFDLSQLPTRLYLWLAAWLLCCNMSEKITSQFHLSICQSKLPSFVGKGVEEGKIGMSMCMSIQVQYLSHLKSPLNLVIIALWASPISSKLILLLPSDLATSHSPPQQWKTSQFFNWMSFWRYTADKTKYFYE